MEQIISGVLVSLLTQSAKKVQAVPINEGDKVKLRAMVALLSVVATCIVAYSNGTLADASTIEIVAGSIMTWIYATLAYVGLVK